MRKLPALLAASALAATLAACTSSGPAPIDGCTPIAGPGSASSLVEVTGAAGKAPTVDFPTPLVSKQIQRTVISEGEGRQIRPGDQVDYDATILDGVDRTVLSATSYDGETYGRGPAGQEQSIGHALACARAGERLVVTGTALELLGPDIFTSSGIAYDRPIVLVLDVRDVYLGKADGFNQLPLDGMPTVVTAVDGTPGITMATLEPPTELRVATIKLGSGPKVEEDNQIVMHFTIWNWPTVAGVPTVNGSTWENGIPSSFAVNEETLPEGVLQAVLGTPVGSQMLTVVPASEDETRPAQIYVIDILGIQG